MNPLIFVVLFDMKAGVYQRPVLMNSIPEAIRSFGDLISDKDTLIGKHFADFQLIKIGEFDAVNAVMVGCTHEVLASGSDFVSGKVEE